MFTKHANSTYLPEKHLLAKRLAQCLTSSLPSGVHLKALETYRIVFMRIGAARLARDLPLYAGGLFPLFSYSATSLKPALLALYESQFLPLGPSLAPLLDGFVLAIFPGLEDESSEFFERSTALLDSVATAVGDPECFCRSLWRALLLAPPMRLPAANYIRARLTSDKPPSWTKKLLSDMPLVSHAMAAALNDRSALVQRSVLDLLLGELSLDLPFFEQTDEDCQAAAVALVRGVFGALLRKDMSLTKRVHSWFLGGKEGERAVAYCNKYSRRWLLGAIDGEIARAGELSGKDPSHSVASIIRPCKVVGGLVDRGELFSSIASSLSLRILRYARMMLGPGGSPFEREVHHAVLDVVAQLGSRTIFKELESFVGTSLESDDADVEQDKYDLLAFALSFAQVKDEDVRQRLLPALLRVAVDALHRISARPQVLKSAVSFCGAAMGAIDVGSMQGAAGGEIRKIMPEIASSFISFFVAWLATSVRASPLEMRRAYADISVDDEVSAEFETASMRDDTNECPIVARVACNFLTTLVACHVCGRETTEGALQAAAKCASAGDMRIALSGARAYAEVARAGRDDAASIVEEQTYGVVRKAWRLLHPSLPTATAPNAQVWLLLQRQFPEHTNVVVADGILSQISARRLRNLERFACVWRLAVEHRLCPVPADAGLFLMLDALDDRDWAPKMLARAWLSDALAIDAGAVVDAPLRLLLTPEACSRGPAHEFMGVYDAPRALYAFQLLRSVVESSMLGAGGSSGVSGADAGLDGSGDSWERQRSFTDTTSVPQGLSQKDIRNGAHSLASSCPSARTLAALATVFGSGSRTAGRSDDAKGEGDSEGGPIKLQKILPALDYVSVLAITALGYLRGRVPEKYASVEKHPLYDFVNGDARHANGHVDVLKLADSTDSTLDDDSEWVAAGLGFKPISQLHGSVVVAAAEFLAKLMASVPAAAQSSGKLAERLADPMLRLLANAITNRDSVLQMHFIEAIEALVIAEGRAFPTGLSSRRSSFSADNATEPMNGSALISKVTRPAALATRLGPQEAGYLEAHPLFLPWVLTGLSQACKAPSDGRDIGSQEVLGLRRRWVRFVSTIVKHISVSLPNIAEGTILTLCKLLDDRHVRYEADEADVSVGAAPVGMSESEFSRIDERLLLLKGLASLSSTSLNLFEHALEAGELSDGNGITGANLRDVGGPLSTYGGSAGAVASQGNGTHTSAISPGFSMTAAPHRSGKQGSSSGEGPPHAPAASIYSGGTASMMSAMNNPFRMLNDFVSNVFTGSGTDGLSRNMDPRRSAARALFMHLPALVEAIVQTWGPQSDSSIATSVGSGIGRRPSTTGKPPLSDPATPRLSRELPRERRQAQRSAVLSVVAPLFESRPTDVVAGIVAMFCGSNHQHPKSGLRALRSMSIDMLRAVPMATPELVVTCASELLQLAMKWSNVSTIAEDGKLQMKRRLAAVRGVSQVVDNGFDTDLGCLEAIGASSVQNSAGFPIAGAASSDEDGTTGQAYVLSGGGSSPRTYSLKLFHPGDFFAAYPAGDVETGVLRFLEEYFEACRDSDDLHGGWGPLHVLTKEVQVSHTRKASIIYLCRALSAFVCRSPVPYPDKRCRKEIMLVSATVLSTCGSMAANNMDMSSEVPPGASSKDVKARYSVLALEALAMSVAALIDSAYLDDKAQVVATASVASAPAIAALRRTAAKSASPRSGSGAPKPHHDTNGATRQRNAEEELDDAASLAAADILLNIAKRDWGSKLARRDLVGLLDDPNFFFGKHGQILSRLASLVSEVIASGGAAAILSSIGSTTPVTSTGIPGLFTGRDSESVLRARAVRRVAFCVFVAEPDHYQPQLPTVLERLRDSLRVAGSGLVAECLLCLRVLLLRTGPSSIAAFRATTLSEMFRIASEPSKNLRETLAALQFLDLITLISPPDFGYVRCFFFSSDPSNAALEDKKPGDEKLKSVYRPLIPLLTTLCTPDQDKKQDTSVSPLRMEPGCTVFPGRLNGPLTEDFVGQYAAALAIRNRNPAMATATPDIELIRKELEQEFVQ